MSTEEKKETALHQIKLLMIENDVSLTDVIDITIESNALIGVGLISLGDGLKEYCYSKIPKRPYEGD